MNWMLDSMLRSAFGSLLGRVTMYRLILSLLATTAVASLALSVIGIIPFPPLSLGLSLLAAVGGTVAATWLAALIVRATPHLESMLITGLILYFLFLPGTDAQALGGIALAGVIAGASKYLLAVRGRHIVNPAAIGALTVSLLQLGTVGWWVATPALLPFTLIGAFLILYRTKRLALGSVFIAVAATLIVGRLMAFGDDLLPAIGTAFGSYPIIFLAGFMLTEPLTLPPRRWQQLLVAAIVAVLFAVPFSVPLSVPFVLPVAVWVLYSSPELALVVGNLVAFTFGQRRAVKLTLVSKKQLTDRTWELGFQPARPVTFRAGQYVELTIPHSRSDRRGSRRYFSISSAPGDGSNNPPLTIAFTVALPSSSFKTELLALAEGSLVRATGVGGDFLLPRNHSTPIALIAGGIGITPFASQLASAPIRRDCVVVYSLTDADQIPYADVLTASGARVVLVAPTAPTRLPAGWEYAEGGPLNAPRLRELLPDVASRRVYVSGPPKMVTSIRASLRTLRVRRVATDHFSGY
jgi:ferredoxin-NADP reductase/Na+-transporting NADH:ubiquinone oxidoreductase subunit NqrB